MNVSSDTIASWSLSLVSDGAFLEAEIQKIASGLVCQIGHVVFYSNAVDLLLWHALAETGRPMSAKELVEAMLAKKCWSSGGQTPHATISSAMQREIQNKGKQSRFRKTAPGRFALAKSKA